MGYLESIEVRQPHIPQLARAVQAKSDAHQGPKTNVRGQFAAGSAQDLAVFGLHTGVL